MSWLKLFRRKSEPSDQAAVAAETPPSERLGSKSAAQTPEDYYKALALRLANATDGVDRALPVANDFALRIWLGPDDGEQLTYLGNIFAETRELAPEDQERELQRFLNTIVARVELEQSFADWGVARAHLRPVARCMDLITGDGPRARIVYRAFVPGVCEALALDYGASLRYVVEGDLEKWSISAQEAYEAAHENLAALELRLVPYAEPDGPLHCLVNEDEMYLSSYALTPNALRGIAQAVNADIAFAIPHRSLFVACAKDDGAALQQLAEVAQREYEASPRSVSPELYILNGEQVEVFRLAPDHPSHHALALARLHFRGGMYNRQKTVIEALLSERGEDIFVASVSGIEIDECPHTYCVWPEGVDTLLPETDLVILGGGEEGSEWQLQATWEDLFDLLGDYLKKTDAYGLPRYRASAWPSEQQLAELKKRCSAY